MLQRYQTILFILLLFLHASLFAGEPTERQARALMRHSIVLDTHVDTTQRLIWEKFDLANRSSKGSIDIPRMREGLMNAVFFSIWIPGTTVGQEAINQASKQIAAIRQQVRQHPNDLKLCTTTNDIKEAVANGKIAIIMGMEGGHMINHSLRVLKSYADLGVRYMTLTHSVNTDWADSSTDVAKHNGLTEFGKQVVREMNRLGMIVDISHVSDKTFYDALAVSRAPMIASHSSCRTICNSPRNMSDEMIKALADKGGVIQINYYTSFISQPFRDAEQQSAALKRHARKVNKLCGENESCQIEKNAAFVRQLMAEGKLPKVNWTEIVDHIDHVVKLVGADHVGLGSDFDGADMPYGMEDVTGLPKITEALLQRGYSESDIQKILGGNILRVMKAVEETSKQLS